MGNPVTLLQGRRNSFAIGAVFLIAFVTSPSVMALSISLTGVNGFSQASNPTAWNGFVAAAARFENTFSDAVTINLEIGFELLDPGILGSTGSETLGFSYADTRTALIADSLSALDTTAIANLPGGSSLSFLTNDPNTSAVFIDNNGTGNNFVLDINKANAKALGLTGPDTTKDGSVTFNSDFDFDFDPSNGIGAGLFDFEGIAVHEIGHALGFVSGVDIVDLTHGAGPFAPTGLDDFRVFSVLDLYRLSSDSILAGVDFDYATGGTPYFSVDGGATNLGLFSTGSFNGDGNQASHWLDNAGLGIMDPTFAPGELGVLSALDFDAFDAIGWDLSLVAVPIPSAVWLFASGLIGLVGFSRGNQGINGVRLD